MMNSLGLGPAICFIGVIEIIGFAYIIHLLELILKMLMDKR